MDHNREQPASRYELVSSWQHTALLGMGYQLWWFHWWNYQQLKQITVTLSLSLLRVFLTSASYLIRLSVPKSLLSILILNWSRCCWTSSRQEVKHKGLCKRVYVCVWMLVSEISLWIQDLSSQHKHNSLSNFLSSLNPNCWDIKAWLYRDVCPMHNFLCFCEMFLCVSKGYFTCAANDTVYLGLCCTLWPAFVACNKMRSQYEFNVLFVHIILLLWYIYTTVQKFMGGNIIEFFEKSLLS